MSIKTLLVRSTLALLLLGLVGGAYIAFQMRSAGFLREPVYDTVAPMIPGLPHPAILVLHKTNGFIHKEGIPAAGRMLDELARAKGWHLYQTDSAATHNADDLARFDVVIWNNTSGDILTPDQRAAFRDWLEGGGAWLGLHAAGGDVRYAWDWYRDSLLGAQFIGHTMSPQFQDADVLIAGPSPLTAHLPSPWRVAQEEWYAFDRNPRDSGAQVLLALDESSYHPENARFSPFPDTNMPGEHPIAWTRPIGTGTMIYSAIGHQAATYRLPAYREFIAAALEQLTGRSP
jgi:uncharacterized protein